MFHMRSAMTKAIEKNNIDEVKKLIAKHAGNADFLNAVDKTGKTALLKALFCGHLEIAVFLLSCPGIDVNKDVWLEIKNGNRYRCNPLGLALRNYYNDIVNLLVEKRDTNVNWYAYECLTMLQIAVISGQHDNVNKLLLRSDLNLEWLDTLSNNAFTWAHKNLSRASFNTLITQAGVSLHCHGRNPIDGFTYSISYDLIDTLKCLLTLHDFDVNKRLWSGDTILTLAVRQKDPDLLESVLARPGLHVNSDAMHAILNQR